MKNAAKEIKKNTFFLSVVIIPCFSALMIPCTVNAQKIPIHDTAYYVDFPGTITARLYFSQKYAPFTIRASGNEKDIRYTPNTKLTMGIGATYHNASLNLSYGFGFLNNDEEKGKTKGIDLQLHMYTKRWAIDGTAILLKGSYLYPEGFATHNSSGYYYRPDVKINIMGLAAYHVPNAEKFSYRAAMIQNEWQKKSAGSLLYGGTASYGLIKADSALVPMEFDSGFTQAGIENVNFFNAGAGIGYAYTLVVGKHLFVTGSMIGNIGINFTSEEGLNGTNKKIAFGPSAIYKAAIGYNSSTWNISGNWAGNSTWIKGASSGKYFLPTGNFQLILAKKLAFKK